MKVLFLITGLCVSGTAITPGQVYVTNGSFEFVEVASSWSNPRSDYHTPVAVDTSSLPGWTVVSNQINVIRTIWQHADGSQSLDMNGDGNTSVTGGAIQQTLGGSATTGEAYILTFSLSGNPVLGTTSNPRKGIFVSLGGEVTNYVFNATNNSHESMLWESKQWKVTPPTNSAVLRFGVPMSVKAVRLSTTSE